MNRPIVVYDSGVGGLTVSRHLVRLRPSEDLLYVADNGWFPYGNRPELALRARIYTVLDTLVESVGPRAIVIACNTASTAVASTLRDLTDTVPLFVVVPPIEQALRASPSGRHALLATPNTVRCSPVRRLVASSAAPGQVTSVASMALVHLAEQKLAGEPVTSDSVRVALDHVIAPSERRRIDSVILGCTHFPLLLDELAEAFPAARHWSDPALAIAREVVERVPPMAAPGAREAVRALMLTSGHNQGQLQRVFAPHGFRSCVLVPMGETSPRYRRADRVPIAALTTVDYDGRRGEHPGL
jgi:glutamate racemase